MDKIDSQRSENDDDVDDESRGEKREGKAKKLYDYAKDVYELIEDIADDFMFYEK